MPRKRKHKEIFENRIGGPLDQEALRKIKRQTSFTRIVKAQNGLCWFCGELMGADCTREHLLAQSLGGGNEEGNIKAAHAECNSAAGSLSVSDKYRLRDIGHEEGRGEMLMMAKRMRRADARMAFAQGTAIKRDPGPKFWKKMGLKEKPPWWDG